MEYFHDLSRPSKESIYPLFHDVIGFFLIEPHRIKAWLGFNIEMPKELINTYYRAVALPEN